LIKTIIWLFSFIILSFSGCDSSDGTAVEKVSSVEVVGSAELEKKNHQSELDTYYFGFDPRNSPQKDIAQYVPLMNYLEKKTGLKFKLHFTSKMSSTVDDIGKGVTQFALMGAMGFLKAQELYDAKIIVRGLNKDGESRYRSFFVTSANSKITNIKGHSFAFGNLDSTQGNLIPKIELKKKGIKLKSLHGFGYTGSHQECAEAVISHTYEICSMQDQLAQKLAKEGLVKIIYRSSWYPSSGVVAGSLVAKEVIDKVKRALLDFDPQGKDKIGLHDWENTEMPLGFSDVKAEDYYDLKFWALKLGLLPVKD